MVPPPPPQKSPVTTLDLRAPSYSGFYRTPVSWRTLGVTQVRRDLCPTHAQQRGGETEGPVAVPTRPSRVTQGSDTLDFPITRPASSLPPPPSPRLILGPAYRL